MAAPTPVSSLVHSSTLVTAGVYLLIRFNFTFNINYYLLIISLITLFMSGAGAIIEIDLKKVIALSTLRQLGVMIFVLSIGSEELAFFHLLRHALFKSLLFLCAGFYIHSNCNWQDSRVFSNRFFLYPVFSFFFSVASLSLCGFPFLSGFYSKDLILELFFYGFNYFFIFLILSLATLLTLLYRLRLIYISYLMNSFKNSFISIED
jgi:NADH-ubiquinone oxidoreductase chain 5